MGISRLGFSTGVLHRSCNVKEAIKIIKDIGCKTVELGFARYERIEQGQLDYIGANDLDGFDYVSLHAPKISYGNNNETRELFVKIERLNKERPIDLVVVHPDLVQDFTIFDNVSFKVGFENMDKHKLFFKHPDELEKVIKMNDSWKIVLDVNHIYTNDKSLKSTAEFYEKLGDRIAEFHLSGYVELHDSLYQTKQIEIIRAIDNFQTPIIVESVLSPDTIGLERDYILKVIEDIV